MCSRILIQSIARGIWGVGFSSSFNSSRILSHADVVSSQELRGHLAWFVDYFFESGPQADIFIVRVARNCQSSTLQNLQFLTNIDGSPVYQAR